MRPVVGHIAINVLKWGLLGAWTAVAFDQIARSALVIAIYNKGDWKKIVV